MATGINSELMDFLVIKKKFDSLICVRGLILKILRGIQYMSDTNDEIPVKVNRYIRDVSEL